MRTPDPERPGKNWVYFRVRGRPLVRLPDDETSAEFDRRYSLELAALKGQSVRKPNTRTARKFDNERIAFLPGALAGLSSAIWGRANSIRKTSDASPKVPDRTIARRSI